MELSAASQAIMIATSIDGLVSNAMLLLQEDTTEITNNKNNKNNNGDNNGNYNENNTNINTSINKNTNTNTNNELLALRKEICEKVSVLYNSDNSVREWEKFLVRVTLPFLTL